MSPISTLVKNETDTTKEIKKYSMASKSNELMDTVENYNDKSESPPTGRNLRVENHLLESHQKAARNFVT